MSDAHQHTSDHAAAHEGPIKTPKQLIIAVVAAFVVPILAIILLVNFVASDQKQGAGSEFMSEQAVAERIHPVGHVEVKDLSDAAAMKTGEDVFKAQCTACHTAGAAGAPKFGDAAAWGPRIAKGFDALLNSALKGKGAMSPQGGGDFSDLEVGRAVVYMANAGGAKFAEPKLPATAASAATAEAGQPAAPVTTAATAVATAAAPAAEAKADAGQALYNQTCMVCHGAGVAGAPKFGDKAAWAPRAGQGVDALTASAIKGKGAMPPRGGSSATDAEMKAAVTYMVNAAK